MTSLKRGFILLYLKMYISVHSRQLPLLGSTIHSTMNALNALLQCAAYKITMPVNNAQQCTQYSGLLCTLWRQKDALLLTGKGKPCLLVQENRQMSWEAIIKNVWLSCWVIFYKHEFQRIGKLPKNPIKKGS